MKVLIYAHHALGDCVMQVPLIEFYIKKYGDGNVSITVRDEGLLGFMNTVFDNRLDKIYIINKKRVKQTLFSIYSMRKSYFDDIIIVPTIDIKYQTILTSLLRKYRVFIPDKVNSEIHYNRIKYEYSKEEHKVLQNLSVLRQMKQYTFEDIFRYAHSFTPKVETVSNEIIIHPGCGPTQKHKRWPAYYWSRLINSLLDDESTIYITGVENEKDLCTNILNGVNSKKGKIRDLCGHMNIKEMIEFIRLRKPLIITADSGMGHLASLLGSRVISLFGPTSDKITAPFWNSLILKTEKDLKCSPCHLSKQYGNKGCSVRSCLYMLYPKDVYAATKQLSE